MARNGRAEDFDVHSTITHMPDNFIACRDFNHSWRQFTAHWDVEARCYEVQLRCTRCKTIRRRLISREGALIGASYDYVDGYLIKGLGRLRGADRDDLRLQSVLRILEPGAGAPKAS